MVEYGFIELTINVVSHIYDYIRETYQWVHFIPYYTYEYVINHSVLDSCMEDVIYSLTLSNCFFYAS